MTDHQNPNSSSPQPLNKPSNEITSNSHSPNPNPKPTSSDFSGHKIRYVNPPESEIPDPATLREQWKYAIRQYSRWYSHAWGTAILAGISFFALGWIIKGGNPLPSLQDVSPGPPSSASKPESDSKSDSKEDKR